MDTAGVLRVIGQGLAGICSAMRPSVLSLFSKMVATLTLDSAPERRWFVTGDHLFSRQGLFANIWRYLQILTSYSTIYMAAFVQQRSITYKVSSAEVDRNPGLHDL